MSEADYEWIHQHRPKLVECPVCGNRFYCAVPGDADLFCIKCDEVRQYKKIAFDTAEPFLEFLF